MKTDLSSGITLKGSAYTYRIERTLGSGTFGITYLATILSGAGALDGKVHVCIKEFFMHDVNGREGSAVTASTKNGLWNDYRKKFEREARRLAAIKHPAWYRCSKPLTKTIRPTTRWSISAEAALTATSKRRDISPSPRRCAFSNTLPMP